MRNKHKISISRQILNKKIVSLTSSSEGKVTPRNLSVCPCRSIGEMFALLITLENLLLILEEMVFSPYLIAYHNHFFPFCILNYQRYEIQKNKRALVFSRNNAVFVGLL